MSRLPEPRLLDAAHIVMDADEQLGQPIVSNGLPLTKIHHAAFDANLIGIDSDFRIHVSDRLLEIRDGPILDHGFKAMAARLIQLPRRSVDREPIRRTMRLSGSARTAPPAGPDGDATWQRRWESHP
jgi:hypothetical protein